MTIRYGSAVALDRLDPGVRSDELFVLFGCSGSGTTTLLRDGSVPCVKRPLSDGLSVAAIAAGTPVQVGWRPEARILLPAP